MSAPVSTANTGQRAAEAASKGQVSGVSQVRHHINFRGESDENSFPDPGSWNKNLIVVLSMLDYTFCAKAVMIFVIF